MTCSTLRIWKGSVAVLALAAAACGGSAGSSTSTISTTLPVTPTTPATTTITVETATTTIAEADTAFPVTIEHKHGSTEIAELPERIITVGLTDHDAFLALGIVPVGTIEWYGGYPGAVWPWAQDELGDAEPPVVVGNATELDFERIAALDPDVIVGLYAALDRQTYDTLSQIAPTVAQPGDHVDYGIPWQELTRTAGGVVGEVEEAERLVADIEDRFAEIRADHPVFVEATASIAVPYQGIYVYSFNVANSRVLAALGFTQPSELAEMIGDGDGVGLSLERVDLLDLDVLVWLDAVPGEGPVAEPLYTSLDVHTEGREVFVSSSSELGGAMSFSSVLSLSFLLEGLEPMLAAAVDGDPATEVPEA